MKQKKARGFALMTPERRREISVLGGVSSHKNGKAHKWTSEEAAEAGRKGGKISRKRATEPKDPPPATRPR